MTDEEFKTGLVEQLKYLQYTQWVLVCVFCVWGGCLINTVNDERMAGSPAHIVGIHSAHNYGPLQVEIVKPVAIADVEEKPAAKAAEEEKKE